MMLRPQPIGRARALHHAMRVLHVRVSAHLGRQEGGEHPVGPAFPRVSAVARLPHAPAGYADPNDGAVARIDADGMDRRPVRAAAHPLLALRNVPQRSDELPCRSVVARAEQAAGYGAAPQEAVFVRATRPRAQKC